MIKPEEFRDKILEHNEERELLEVKIHGIARKEIPEINSLFHTISRFWKCPKSPIGLCVYDDCEDQYHDECIFCHEPEERK